MEGFLRVKDEAQGWSYSSMGKRLSSKALGTECESSELM